MHFAGWRQSLEAYAAALENAGLAIISLSEPLPDVSEGRDHMRRWTRIPLFLWLKAHPLTDASGERLFRRRVATKQAQHKQHGRQGGEHCDGIEQDPACRLSEETGEAPDGSEGDRGEG